MTIEKLLNKLFARWGNDWVTSALQRLLVLGGTPVIALTDNEVQEYRLLRDWALEMIEAGVANKEKRA